MSATHIEISSGECPAFSAPSHLQQFVPRLSMTSSKLYCMILHSLSTKGDRDTLWQGAQGRCVLEYMRP